jgi:hypothetical protein
MDSYEGAPGGRWHSSCWIVRNGVRSTETGPGRRDACYNGRLEFETKSYGLLAGSGGLIGVGRMRDERKQPHPEYVEAVEVKMDQALPGQAPVLYFHHGGQDPRRVVATIPDLEHRMLYLGRLVSVEVNVNEHRNGSIEAIDGQLALVRYVDWDD